MSPRDKGANSEKLTLRGVLSDDSPQDSMLSIADTTVPSTDPLVLSSKLGADLRDALSIDTVAFDMTRGLMPSFENVVKLSQPELLLGQAPVSGLRDALAMSTQTFDLSRGLISPFESAAMLHVNAFALNQGIASNLQDVLEMNTKVFDTSQALMSSLMTSALPSANMSSLYQGIGADLLGGLSINTTAFDTTRQLMSSFEDAVKSSQPELLLRQTTTPSLRDVLTTDTRASNLSQSIIPSFGSTAIPITPPNDQSHHTVAVCPRCHGTPEPETPSDAQTDSVEPETRTFLDHLRDLLDERKADIGEDEVLVPLMRMADGGWRLIQFFIEHDVNFATMCVIGPGGQEIEVFVDPSSLQVRLLSIPVSIFLTHLTEGSPLPTEDNFDLNTDDWPPQGWPPGAPSR